MGLLESSHLTWPHVGPVSTQTRPLGSSALPPCSGSHSLAAPGSQGPAHGLTRLGKTCLRFGRETG